MDRGAYFEGDQDRDCEAFCFIAPALLPFRTAVLCGTGEETRAVGLLPLMNRP